MEVDRVSINLLYFKGKLVGIYSESEREQMKYLESTGPYHWENVMVGNWVLLPDGLNRRLVGIEFALTLGLTLTIILLGCILGLMK